MLNKGWLVLLIVVSTSSILAALTPEESINELDLLSSEKVVLQYMIKDLKAKGLDTETYSSLFQEFKIKKTGYYDILRAITKKSEILSALKNLSIPYTDQSDVKALVIYLLENYPAVKIMQIGKSISLKKLNKETTVSIYRFLLFFNNYDINRNSVINIAIMMIEKGNTLQYELDAVMKLYLHSKEYRLSPNEITTILEESLLENNTLWNAIKNVENSTFR